MRGRTKQSWPVKSTQTEKKRLKMLLQEGGDKKKKDVLHFSHQASELKRGVVGSAVSCLTEYFI